MKPQRIIIAAVTIALAAAAGYFSLILASPTEVLVGPLRVEFSLHPAWHGKSIFNLPPAGSIEADTHSAPAEANYTLKEIAVSEIEDLTDPGSSARQALVNWREPVGNEVNSLLLRIAIFSIISGTAVAALLRRRWQWALTGAAVGLATAALVGGSVYATYDTGAFQEPRYNGNLSYAPDILNFSQETLANLDTYEDRVPDIAASLFATVSELHRLSPAVQDGETIRVLHISDMHSSAAAARMTKTITDLYQVDFIVDTGDSTDFGTPFETRYFSSYLPLPKPYAWVAGNHDSPTVTRFLKEIEGVRALDGEFINLAGVTLGGFPDLSSTSASPEIASDARQAEEATRIAAAVQEQTLKPFMVAVHDPKQAAKLAGKVPVVLNGHTHRESISVEKGTVYLDAGSTGAGGFRIINGNGESPSTLHILYIRKDPMKLTACDTITIYGFSQEFSVVRRIFGQAEGSFGASQDEREAASSTSSAPAVALTAGSATYTP